jgi:coenzyme F420 hydrogenase subunit beta
MKRYRLRESMNGIDEPPRKTWFWELEAGVIEADRCIQCGTCVAACPSNSIGIGKDTGLPELVKMCTGCSLCWDFCPRGGLRYEATWPPSTPAVGVELTAKETVTKPDPADSYWKLTGAAPGEGLGRVEATYAVRGVPHVDGAQDGGVVTSLLVALLNAGEIDGALVAKPSSDPDEPWKAVPTVAITAGDIRAAAGSFYNQSMALAALDLTGRGLPANPRLAVVGTPCEVAGLRAMQAKRWPTGSHRVDAVTLTIALLCTKSFDYEALMIDELKRRRGIDLERISKVDVTRGRLVVEYLDGAVALDEPIKEFHGASLKGCDECADFLGRAADISVGSVGSNDGWTSVLVRTERGRASFDAARKALDVRELDNAEALIKLDEFDQKIARRALARELDPMGGMFMSYDEHVTNYAGTTRQPVVIRR